MSIWQPQLILLACERSGGGIHEYRDTPFSAPSRAALCLSLSNGSEGACNLRGKRRRTVPRKR
jgi:hypothetical protein